MGSMHEGMLMWTCMNQQFSMNLERPRLVTSCQKWLVSTVADLIFCTKNYKQEIGAF